jgi:hypothetical protein
VEICGAQVCNFSHKHLLQPLKHRSSDSGGYVNFTPKYIIVKPEFQKPRKNPSGRKVTGGERKETEKGNAVNTSPNVLPATPKVSALRLD